MLNISKITDHGARTLAELCYSMHSIDELQFTLFTGPPCIHDKKAFGLNDAQWSEALSAALADKLLDETGPL